MKISLLLLTCLLIGVTLTAQIKLRGQLFATDGNPLSLANIQLLRGQDSVVLQSTTTDTSGSFIINIDSSVNELFLLRFSMVGYVTAYSALQIKKGTGEQNTGTFIMETSNKALATIIIKATKPIYQQKAEGIVVNVENNVLTKGSTALEVLARSAGVIIDQRNNNIILNGKSGVIVMIDGKNMQVPAEQLTGLLSGMNADNIEKIELLTTPPAGYDAAGNAGIINIILKKNKKIGTTGNISITEGYGWRDKSAASASISHASKVINLYSSYSYSYNHTYSNTLILSDQYMPFMGGNVHVNWEDTTKLRRNNHDAMLGLDIKPNANTLAGINLTYNHSKTASQNYTDATYNVLPDSILTYKGTSNFINRWNNITGSAFFEKKWAKQQKLNIEADYLLFNNKLNSDTKNNFTDKHGNKPGTNEMLFAPQVKGNANTRINVGVLKADYSAQLNEKLQFEAGIKSSVIRSSSSSGLQSIIDGNWNSSTQTSNNIVMKERVNAAYISLNTHLNQTINAVVGIRYEYSDTRMINILTGAKITERKFGKLFPNILLTKTINNASQLQLSYTRRISRPSYNDLASFVSYSDPTAVYTGNPFLKPTITDNIKLGFTHKKYAFAILYSYDKNAIIRNQLTGSPAGDILFISPQNLPKQTFLSLQATVPFTVTDWWRMNYSFNGGLRHFEVDHTKTTFAKTYMGYSINFGETLNLSKGFVGEISGWYNSRLFDGTKRQAGFLILNAGIKKELKRNAGTLQLAVTDILGKEIYHINYGLLTQEAFNIRNDVKVYTESTRFPIFKLTYTLLIHGNAKNSGLSSPGSQEENNRIIRN